MRRRLGALALKGVAGFRKQLDALGAGLPIDGIGDAVLAAVG